ncbi:acyltransferase family protein [Escherichia coli 1-182-04_S4_C1]|nr:acyltransferase family protein [Escherichia coli 1-182-04_S4_C1]
MLIVMLFHAKVSGFSLGWSGVPLFFCLSGFLITSILIEDKDSGFSNYIKRFLINRSLRIFPLFYAYLLVNFILLIATGKPTDGYLWFITYLQNYYIGINVTTPGILGHTWSLAVEEQFYWLWPLFIFFINKKNMNLIFIILIITSSISRYFIFQITDGNPYIVNVTLISCIDMLVLGALFSKIKDDKYAYESGFLTFIAGVGLVLNGINSVGLNAFWNPVDWAGKCWYMFTAFGMIFSSAIFFIYKWSVLGKKQIITKALSLKPLTFTGKISYGLYMWHLLCFSIANKMSSLFGVNNNAVIIACGFAIAYIVSIASYYLFEIHFLKLKRKTNRNEDNLVTV